MTATGGLVDLSLFAESPTSDWRFTSIDLPSYPRDGNIHASVPSPEGREFPAESYNGSYIPMEFIHPTQRNVTYDIAALHHNNLGRGFYAPPADPVVRPLPRSYDLKPLPALPPKKLCKPRPTRTRNDTQSRCILNRLKKTKSEEPLCPRRCSLQQRRNARSAPQLTLSVPEPVGARSGPAPEMVWLSDEQMWLVVDQHPRDLNLSPPSYSMPLARPQPSPSVYSIPENTPPLTPDNPRERDPLIDGEGLSPIQSQFRSLIVDAERRSPLFQEAMQTIPDLDSTIETLMNQASDDGWPVYDPAMYETPDEPDRPIRLQSPISPESPHTPQSSFEEIEREWNSAVSMYSEHSSGLKVPQHQHQVSGDTSYYSAMSEIGDEFPRDEDPIDFYLEHLENSPTMRPVLEGIATSIPSRVSTQSWAPSMLSNGPSPSSQSERGQSINL